MQLSQQRSCRITAARAAIMLPRHLLSQHCCCRNNSVAATLLLPQYSCCRSNGVVKYLLTTHHCSQHCFCRNHVTAPALLLPSTRCCCSNGAVAAMLLSQHCCCCCCSDLAAAPLSLSQQFGCRNTALLHCRIITVAAMLQRGDLKAPPRKRRERTAAPSTPRVMHPSPRLRACSYDTGMMRLR